MGLSPATDTHGLSAIPSWHGHHRLKHCHPAVASHSTPDNAAWYLTSKFSSWSATFRDIKAAAYDMLPHPQVIEDLRLKTLSMKCGQGNSRGGSRLNGECRHRNVVNWSSVQGSEYSWTVQILRLVKRGQGSQALRLYDDMKESGVQPSTYTFVALLKACCLLQDLQSVKRVHADLARYGLESDVHVGSMLVFVYAKCRSLEDARSSFEKISQRNAVSWNTIILGYSQINKAEEALKMYTRMQREGVVPDARTYVSALKACSSSLTGLHEKSIGDGIAARKLGCFQIVKTIHADIKKTRFQSDVFVANILVDVYAKCGKLELARDVFEAMPHRTVVSWNAMICGYSQTDTCEEALQLFDRMQQEGFEPNDRTYVSVLMATRNLADSEKNEGAGTQRNSRCLEIARALHADILKGGFQSNIFVSNMLVDVYAKCGSLQDARNVFEIMPSRDVISWNTMILGYAQMDQGEMALQLYTRMRRDGQTLNDRTYVSVLKACGSLAETIASSNCDNTAMEGCLKTVQAIHADSVKDNFESDVFVGTMLVDVYAKCGSMVDARRLFEKMPCRDVVSWNAMILGYIQRNDCEVALLLYNRMQQEGVVPNELTYSGALNACGSVSALDKGKEIHAQFLKAGHDVTSPSLISDVINMYGKCGSMGDAQEVFDAMPTRDINAWNALIAGYAYQGETELVFHWFRRMKEEGMQPDSSTLLSILTACSHGGLVDLGQQYFKALSKDYGIIPTIKHYTCVVDLLGRAGQVDKAMEMVQGMPFNPDSAVWECVLSACRKWRSVELGRRAFDCAVRLDTKNSSAYTLMSNIYAAARMQVEGKEIQAMRAKSQARKQPGQSWWTDSRGAVHVFTAGDIDFHR